MIWVVSNQPARFFVTAKTQKLETIQEINVAKLKLPLIIDQTCSYAHNAVKVIAKYLKSLAKNEFTVSDTLILPELIKNSNKSDEYKDSSCNIPFTFTSIPVEDTITYTINTCSERDRTFLQKVFIQKTLRELVKGAHFLLLEKKIISRLFTYMCKIEFDFVVPASLHCINAM